MTHRIIHNKNVFSKKKKIADSKVDLQVWPLPTYVDYHQIHMFVELCNSV